MILVLLQITNKNVDFVSLGKFNNEKKPHELIKHIIITCKNKNSIFF
jgi:hypothetical protein